MLGFRVPDPTCTHQCSHLGFTVQGLGCGGFATRVWGLGALGVRTVGVNPRPLNL